MSHVEMSLVKLNALMDLITCSSWGSFILIHFCSLAVAVQDLFSRQMLAVFRCFQHGLAMSKVNMVFPNPRVSTARPAGHYVDAD